MSAAALSTKALRKQMAYQQEAFWQMGGCCLVASADHHCMSAAAAGAG
jgi:hypothetical protein